MKSLSENEKKVLNCIQKDSSFTRNQISANLGISVRTVDRAISKLMKNRIVERQGSRKAGAWIVNEQ
ncbi:MAG: winged helix-turn-helix transcriptional regulator [Oscillospiraceae bacterium]|nr:winged helix-turn-helix transcriptional regulator [Oscillospiraceae bacterium]